MAFKAKEQVKYNFKSSAMLKSCDLPLHPQLIALNNFSIRHKFGILHNLHNIFHNLTGYQQGHFFSICCASGNDYEILREIMQTLSD